MSSTIEHNISGTWVLDHSGLLVLVYTREDNSFPWLYRGQILELWLEKDDLFFEDSSQGPPASYHQVDNISSYHPNIA